MSKILLLIACLLALCVCSPQKKSCNRPEVFKNSEVLTEYINCVKALTAPERYGKRSLQASKFFQKLHPSQRDFDRDYWEDFLYHIMKSGDIEI